MLSGVPGRRSAPVDFVWDHLSIPSLPTTPVTLSLPIQFPFQTLIPFQTPLQFPIPFQTLLQFQISFPHQFQFAIPILIPLQLQIPFLSRTNPDPVPAIPTRPMSTKQRSTTPLTDPLRPLPVPDDQGQEKDSERARSVTWSTS